MSRPSQERERAIILLHSGLTSKEIADELEVPVRTVRYWIKPFRVTPKDITAREAEIERMKLMGKRNKRIAMDLGISEKTVQSHVHSLYHKRCVSSVSELSQQYYGYGAIGGCGAIGTGPVWGLQ